jgi:hypothetical protein
MADLTPARLQAIEAYAREYGDMHFRDLLAAYTTLRSRLRWLEGQWRAKGSGMDAFHATMGIGWKSCADDLAAPLAADAPPPEE